MMRTYSLAAPLLVLSLLAACSVGPDYRRPALETPAGFRSMDGWKPAEPRDHEPRSAWWTVFDDPVLNELQRALDTANPTLAVAEARYRQARALAQGARANLFPLVTGDVGAGRSQSAGTTSGRRGPATSYTLGADATWEPDLWGRVSRLVEANVASAQGTAADVEATRLSLHSELAQNYFQLRAVEAQQRLFADTVQAFETSLKLTQNRYDAGVVARADVVQALAQLKTTQAQAMELGVQRAQLEHAIAVLLGRAPASFSVPTGPLPGAVPVTPPGLPSALLERRPDVAGAERRIAAANAQIGVARAAYFPSLQLSAGAGFQSAQFANWLEAPARVWSLGAGLAQVLFDAGSRAAVSAQALAAYDAQVASYRQTVLTALREVEDNLIALRLLEEAAAVQNEAVAASRLSVQLALNQYRAGTVSYLNVVTAQATALNNERAAVDLHNRRLAAAVLLIRALGGGWDATALPTPDAVLPRR